MAKYRDGSYQMPFEYSCFISYRHGRHRSTKRMLDAVVDGLRGELDTYFDKDVYVDTSRLKGGDFFNRSLATALCKSVCMVVLYTPNYFSLEHAYCAREFRAMEKLERKRIKLLSTTPSQGLIIPIVLRGPHLFPKDIQNKRLFYDFSNSLLHASPESVVDTRKEDFHSMASYMFERYKEYSSGTANPCEDCDQFRFPTEREVQPFLEKVSPTFLDLPWRRKTP